jgi:hypothetical protein
MRSNFEAERAGRGLNFADFTHTTGKISISDDCQAAKPRDNLTQELESLCGNIGLLDR